MPVICYWTLLVVRLIDPCGTRFNYQKDRDRGWGGSGRVISLQLFWGVEVLGLQMQWGMYEKWRSNDHFCLFVLTRLFSPTTLKLK